jgi:lipopolysaccharide export system protein LptA
MRGLFSAAIAAMAAAAVTLVPGRMSAEPAPDAEPVEMSADHLELDMEAKTAVLTGHVKLTRGPMSLACPRVDARYDRIDRAPHVTWARGSGGVTADVKGVHAEAPEVDVDLAARVMELRGGVRITRGDGWITADKASIHIATGKVTMSDVKGSLPVPKPTP